MHTKQTASFSVASFTEPKNQHQDNYLTDAVSRGARGQKKGSITSYKVSIRHPPSGQKKHVLEHYLT